jgi:ABC-type glutathione transport system ATPase component
MARVVLEVRDLWVGEGRGAAIQGVGFSVGAGQVVGLLGGAGAGKSRLLRCIGLDYPPSSGSILLRGEELGGATPERRRRVRSTQIELVHPPAPDGVDDSTVPSGRPSLLIGATRRATVPVAGMRQRIQIAKALTNRVDVLLLDEPFAGVEPAVQARIRELLGRLRQEAGTAVVLATRDPELCATLADELVVLDEGAVVEQGDAPVVLTAPADPRALALLTGRLRSA